VTTIEIRGDHAVDVQERTSVNCSIGPRSPDRSYRTRAQLESPQLVLPNESEDMLWLSAGLLKVEEIADEKLRKSQSNIEIVVSEPGRWLDVHESIEEILELLLGVRVKVWIVEGHRSPTNEDSVQFKANSVVLFSGGVDSLVGILLAKVLDERLIGAYVGHTAGVTGVVNRFADGILKKMQVPVWEYGLQQTRRQLYQLRGFAYLISGMVTANAVRAEHLDVTECGITMFQPALLANDVVTMTTDPRLIEQTILIARKVMGRCPSVIRPFENLTKAEVMALCPEPELLGKTLSCVSSQFSCAASSHCGTCWGCLIRECGALVAGAVHPGWAKDVLRLDIGQEAGRRAGETIKEESLANMFLLLDFARHCLEDKLPWWTQSRIDEFRKTDLFRRFALDTYCALHVLYGSDPPSGSNRYAARAYDETIRRGLVTREKLENRIEEVREKKWQPDFEAPSKGR
jgi:hypothetical protein